MNKMRLLVLLLLTCAAPAFAGQETLAQNFANPPDSARPGVWWRWIDGNVSREGITRDLDEMARGGFRSAEIFDVAGAPQVGKAGMMKPLWRELFHHAINEADRNDIQLGVVPAAGWGTGGPWIGPEDAAKVLRYTETQVDGPLHLSQVLPSASAVGGYYKDVATVAFREKPHRPVVPAEVTANSVLSGYCGEENWPAADVVDGDPNTVWRSDRAPSAGNPVWIQFTYHEPLTATALYLAGSKDGGPRQGELQASESGLLFHTVAAFEMARGEGKRIAFIPTTARFFRLVITDSYAPDVQLAEAWLLRAGDEPDLRPGIQWWWFKSANRGFWDWPNEGPAVLDQEYPDAETSDLRQMDVLDLSAHLSPSGKLEWDVPPGRWTILRFGATLLGEAPRMMSRALQGGYEADPFSPKAADRMFDSTAQVLAQDAGPQAGKALAGILVDSWEYGASARGFQPNWTTDFIRQFQHGRGYSLIPWLPALARRVVDGRSATDRFLWDFRQTLGDQYLDFYGRLTERAHQLGMYSRAENGYGTYPFQHIDGLAAFARVDRPMGEFWFRDPVMTQHYNFADSVRTAASASHIYGRRLVSAESLTVGHGISQAPADYKPDLDAAFCDGLNSSMLHLWSEQYDPAARPGLDTYDLINANMTWWDEAPAFISYIARCQLLLQQGRFVADACYFTGEGTCKFVPGRNFANPTLPAGYEFDGINAEVILNRLTCRNSRLVLPDGMSYRYLALPPVPGWKITLPTLRKINTLVNLGATIIGPKPGGTPGLTGGVEADLQSAQITQLLWGKNPAVRGNRRVGRGRVLWGESMDEILAADKLEPDFQAVNAGSDRAGLLGASWIWHGADGSNPPPGERLFRTSITLPERPKVVSALISATADNLFELSVNGIHAASGSDFHKVVDVNVAGDLQAGRNDLVVRATNTGSAPNPAGLILRLVVTLQSGARIVRTTGDENWLSSTGDGVWVTAAVVAPLGGGPWGPIETNDASINWTHRSTNEAEIYFLSNPKEHPERLTGRFRVSGKTPEIWDPVTGSMREATSFQQAGDHMSVPLEFAANGSLFVLFRKPIGKYTSGRMASNFPELKPVQELTGPWTVQFDPKWGGPATIAFDHLDDWSARPEAGIKYYSGAATYVKHFSLDPKGSEGARTFLELGTVKNVAAVKLNGHPLGTVWCAPWRIELPPGLLKNEGNDLEIKVANLWPNRLIGDAKLPPEQRLTRTNVNFSPDAPLLSSGLLGPVRILEGGPADAAAKAGQMNVRKTGSWSARRVRLVRTYHVRSR